jgi:hypothetical protein
MKLSVGAMGVKLRVKMKGRYWMRVFQNRVLKRIFGPDVEEETGRWGKLYNNGGRRIKIDVDI